jgi:exosortase
MQMTFSESMDRFRYELMLAVMLLSGLYFSIVADMAIDWYRDDNYSHGFLVPLISAYFLRERWNVLKTTQVMPSNIGFVVVTLGLFQLVIASVGNELFTARSSLVVIIAGMVLCFFGTEVFKITRLPIMYLLLMVPLPYIVYNAFAFPLKMFVSWVSVSFLKMIGLTVVRDGNIIMFPAITLEVADACSGLRSLVSILALSIAYAFILPISHMKRWALILSAIVMAVFTNALRVIITGILANYWGAAAAQGLFHEFAGMAVFVLTMTLLAALGLLMRDKI